MYSCTIIIVNIQKNVCFVPMSVAITTRTLYFALRHLSSSHSKRYTYTANVYIVTLLSSRTTWSARTSQTRFLSGTALKNDSPWCKPLLVVECCTAYNYQTYLLLMYVKYLFVSLGKGGGYAHRSQWLTIDPQYIFSHMPLRGISMKLRNISSILYIKQPPPRKVAWFQR